MNTKQKTNWWIDLILFAGFITTYFFDLTGVAVHQWIGIFSATLSACHLFIHWDWVGEVSQRFFAKTSNQARFYYVLDGLLLLGIVLIGITGLAISTWLNIHITISIAALVILFVKLAFHWRWIVHAARKIWGEPVRLPAQNAAARPTKFSSGLWDGANSCK